MSKQLDPDTCLVPQKYTFIIIYKHIYIYVQCIYILYIYIVIAMIWIAYCTFTWAGHHWHLLARDSHRATGSRMEHQGTHVMGQVGLLFGVFGLL